MAMQPRGCRGHEAGAVSAGMTGDVGQGFADCFLLSGPDELMLDSSAASASYSRDGEGESLLSSASTSGWHSPSEPSRESPPALSPWSGRDKVLDSVRLTFPNRADRFHQAVAVLVRGDSGRKPADEKKAVVLGSKVLGGQASRHTQLLREEQAPRPHCREPGRQWAGGDYSLARKIFALPSVCVLLVCAASPPPAESSANTGGAGFAPTGGRLARTAGISEGIHTGGYRGRGAISSECARRRAVVLADQGSSAHGRSCRRVRLRVFAAPSSAANPLLSASSFKSPYASSL